jgi:hypothetical protein
MENNNSMSVGMKAGLWIALIAILGIGAYFVFSGSSDKGVATDDTASTTASTTGTTFCTMDARMCPDGSYVGRTGPNCQFVCPTGTSTKANAGVNYPADYLK